MKNRSIPPRLLHVGAAFLCAAAVVLLLTLAGASSGLQNMLYDLAARGEARLMPKEEPQVELVYIDQYSLDWVEKNLGYAWPWPRELYGLMAGFLSQARSQTYDIIFSGQSSYGPEDDQRCAALMERAGNVVLAEATASRLTAGNLHYGSARGIVCADGVLRQYPLWWKDDRTEPSLGVAALLKAGLPKLQIPAQRSAYLKFRGKSPSYPAHNAAEILASAIQLVRGGEAQISPKTFAGKLVFVGYSAPGLLDRQAVPTDGAMPGTEIHANFAANFLEGKLAWPLAGWVDFLLAIFLGIGFAWLAGTLRKPLALAGGALGAILAPFILDSALYHFGYVASMGIHSLMAILAYIFSIIFAYIDERKRKAFIKSAFSQYLAPSVVDALMRNPQRLSLGGEERRITVFFSDIEGFTGMAESMSPQELGRFMNSYLSLMTSIILEEQGTIDKYVGDAIVAFWNAPLDQEDHAARAVRAALRCQEALSGARLEFISLGNAFPRTRIGIHTGKAIVGNMGSEFRFNYTALGDAVNTASRLEGANKSLGTEILVSSDTVEHASHSADIHFRRLGLIVVPGKKAAVEAWEPWLEGKTPSGVQPWEGLKIIQEK
ncbi:MAG: adenylate/guanylate cyclase domain-containing protein [Spirochaetaceae bacterium]|nr:adenylate/guanylate cyclase domain-containing protein [Spirochaetaceae bacterium]